jgi:hypothetical protein
MVGLRAQLTDFSGEARVINTKLVHLEQEIDHLEGELSTLKSEVAAMKAAPGQTAIRWADTIGIALVTAALLAMAGIAWTVTRPASGAPAAHAVMVPGPHAR